MILMVILMVINSEYSDLMVINGDLMVIHGDSWRCIRRIHVVKRTINPLSEGMIVTSHRNGDDLGMVLLLGVDITAILMNTGICSVLLSNIMCVILESFTGDWFLVISNYW